jgi:phosphoadenosine phosphosulfate reductase
MSLLSAAGVNEMMQELTSKTIAEQLSILAQQYPGLVKFSSSLGQEDQVITDIIAGSDIDINIFTIDTGRLFSEVYDLIDKTNARYKIKMNVYFPDFAAVETLVHEKGVNSFYESVQNRVECCNIRKVNPLNRALQGAKVWVTGLRREQSANRESMQLLEWVADRQMYKFNPLINWTYSDVINHIKQNEVPYNPLHDKGFVSIGCSPCTRAISNYEDVRAGRWWWESSHKECGLHK